MAVLRTCWLIALVLVATTVAGSARSTAAAGGKRDAAREPAGPESPERADQQETGPAVASDARQADPTGDGDVRDGHAAPCSHEREPDADEESDATPGTPEIDLWDGGAGRSARSTVCSGWGLPPGHRRSAGPWHAAPCGFARQEAPSRHVAAQRCWLICRDAHAPPSVV